MELALAAVAGILAVIVLFMSKGTELLAYATLALSLIVLLPELGFKFG